MFSLPKSISELPDINQGVANAKYEQVSASRDITGPNWANGAQSFKFEVSGAKHWVPSKSYLRLRLKYVQKAIVLGNPADVSPSNGQYTAAPFLCGNLYQSCEFRIGDQTVSKLGQYVGQVDAFKTRISKGGYYLNNVGNTMNATSTDKALRNEIIAGEDGTAPSSYAEFMWQPPLAIFDQHILPSGRFELLLNPENQNQWRINAVLTKDANKVAGVDFDVIVDSCFLYVHTIEGPSVSNTTYALNLENYTCMADKVQGSTENMRFFDVSPSTVALACAYQDVRVNNSNMSSSLFRVSPDAAVEEWGEGEEQNKISSFYINYAGMQKPQPNMDTNATNSKQNLVQRYIENQLENGLLHSDAAPESYSEFRDRGMYMLYNFPKSGENASTRVQVSQSFKNAEVANMRLLLFSISRTSAEITVTNGAVSNVLLKER